jgi:acyl carrier protein
LTNKAPDMSNSTFELKNVDSEDLDDVLMKIEKSFHFKFETTELKDVKTFGHLCDIIINKIQGKNIDDCTTQQAFYKLRDAIASSLYIDNNTFSQTSPKTKDQRFR